MNKKFLYKLLLIFALLACTLLISNTKSFAAIGTNVNGDTIEFPDFSSLVVDTPYYFIFVYEEKINLITIDYLENDTEFSFVYSSGFNLINVNSQYRIDDSGNWYLYRTLNAGMHITGCISTNDFSPIYYSNFDLIDSNREVVFQQPPQVQETTLAPIVEGVETKKTLAEVVGILPVVLVVIVGLLAMRKAIRFLMRTLKQG